MKASEVATTLSKRYPKREQEFVAADIDWHCCGVRKKEPSDEDRREKLLDALIENPVPMTVFRKAMKKHHQLHLLEKLERSWKAVSLLYVDEKKHRLYRFMLFLCQ